MPRMRKRPFPSQGIKFINRRGFTHYRPGTPMYEKDLRILEKVNSSGLFTQGEKEYIYSLFFTANGRENASPDNEVELIDTDWNSRDNVLSARALNRGRW